jgi:glycosidase
MDGGVDPTNRRAMDWFQTKTAEAKWVSEVALFRSKSDTLKKGITQPLESSARILAFQRSYQSETLKIIVNFSDYPYESLEKNCEVILGNTTNIDGHCFVNANTLVVFRNNLGINTD